MIAFDKNLLLVLLTLAALVTLPMALAGLRPPTGGIGLFPIVIFVEVLIYFIAAMVMNSRANAGMAAGTAIIMLLLRGVCSFLGAIAYTAFSETAGGADLPLMWANPASAIIQVIILVVAGPYILALLVPEFIGRDEADKLKGGDAPSAAARRPQTSGSMESVPTGGYVQVFSFEELAAQLKKSPGLEGFIVNNDEGFIVWRDLPMNLDADSLTARVVESTGSLGGLMANSGLSRVRRIAVESRDHLLFAGPLNQSFGLILIFSARSSAEETQSRVQMLMKTAREFLQWKYPSLPLATGHTRDRISLEMV